MTATNESPSPHDGQVPFGVLRSPREILFGAGVIAALPRVVSELGIRAFVCTDPVIARSDALRRFVQDARGQVVVEVYSAVEPELPLANVHRAIDAARAFEPDVIVGFGGGSAMDLAKLVSLGVVTSQPLSDFYGENLVPSTVLPIVAVPTTAGTGSEVTPVAVVADPGRALKVGISSPYLIPIVAIVDPNLTITCPPSVTAFSGIDALTHAIESYSASRRDPELHLPLPVFVGANSLSRGLGLEAARHIGPNLHTAVRDGANQGARSSMAYGSMLAGLAFGTGGTHLSHALQYPIGDLTHTPHGLGVGLLLPYVMEACLPSSAQSFARLGVAMGVVDEGSIDSHAAEATINFIVTLRSEIGVPHTLRELGVGENQLPKIVELSQTVARLVTNAPATDPRALLEPVARRAWAGISDVFAAQSLVAT